MESGCGCSKYSVAVLSMKMLTIPIPHLRWNEQREYMNMSWNCGKFLATVFVLVNLLGQLGGVVMVLGRLRVQIACGLLFFIVVLQVSFSGVCATGDDDVGDFFLLDRRILNLMGSSVPAEKPRPHRCPSTRSR